MIINIEDLYGEPVAMEKTLYDIHVNEGLSPVDVEEVCALEREGYQTYNTYDSDDRRSMILSVRTVKWCIVLSWIVLCLLNPICSKIGRSFLGWLCPGCLICSILVFISVFFYHDLFIYISLYFASLTVIAMISLLIYAIYLLCTYATNEVILLFGITVILLSIYVIMLCKVIEIHKLMPLFDDDDLQNLKSEERLCGFAGGCRIASKIAGK